MFEYDLKRKSEEYLAFHTDLDLDIYSHADEYCEDTFRSRITEDYYYPFDALGPVKVPQMLWVRCESCRLMFPEKEFLAFLEGEIASQVLEKNKPHPKEIRFVRLFFDVSKEEVAGLLGVTPLPASRYGLFPYFPEITDGWETLQAFYRDKLLLAKIKC